MNEAEALQQQAYDLFANEDYQGAYDTLLKLELLQGQSPQISNDMGVALFKLDQLNQALARFKQAAELEGGSIVTDNLIELVREQKHQLQALKDQRRKATTKGATPISDSSINEDLGALYAEGLCGFKLFHGKEDYLAWDNAVQPHQENIERVIEQATRFTGYCPLCNKGTVFSVSGGLQLENHVHLREGMICSHCGIHNRGRLLGSAILRYTGPQASDSKYLLMEARTPLFRAMKEKMPGLIGSEFFGYEFQPGESVFTSSGEVRNESILGLSFQNESLDLVAHADVLEHVPDASLALQECYRVLKRGGLLIFSMPFSPSRDETVVRARIRPDSTIEHLLPASYHGPHLVYYDYSWDIMELCRSAGFQETNLGVCLDPLQGLISTGRFGGYYMQPLFFICRKA